MHSDMTPAERRAFELFGEPCMRARPLTATVAREFGLTEEEASEIARKVLRQYGTPRLAAAKEALRRLEQIRF
jgi:hypothetical protein